MSGTLNPTIGGTPPVASSVIPLSIQDPGAGGSSFYQSLVASNQSVGGQPQQDPSTGQWYNAQGQTASSQNGPWTTYGPSPSDTPTIAPTQTAYYASVFNDSSHTAGGGTPNPLISDPNFVNPGGNPDYAQNPTTGYYDLTPRQDLQGFNPAWLPDTLGVQQDH